MVFTRRLEDIRRTGDLRENSPGESGSAGADADADNLDCLTGDEGSGSADGDAGDNLDCLVGDDGDADSLDCLVGDDGDADNLDCLTGDEGGARSRLEFSRLVAVSVSIFRFDNALEESFFCCVGFTRIDRALSLPFGCELELVLSFSCEPFESIRWVLRL
jgi:hypothetical protein